MTKHARRAVFTGLGVITSLGTDPDSLWSALLEGKSGLSRVTEFDVSVLPCRIAGALPDFDAKKFLPPSAKDARKSLKVMAKTVQLGVCASQKAMDDAGLQKGSVPPERFGIEFACVMVASELDDLLLGARHTGNPVTREVDYAAWGGEKGLGNVTPLWMLKYLPNMPACHTSIFFDAQGPNNTITASEISSLLALGEAWRLLQRDKADFFLVGGTESKINPVSFARHNIFSELSLRNDTPAEALRPFDRNRAGTVLSEAAATLGLEELGRARGRNAKIYGELVGLASGFDNGLKGPIFAGVIRKALAEAGIGPADVDHVNAAAGGLRTLDAFEARAIAEVFGTSVPVWAPKAQLGTSGTAAGLVELSTTLLALHHGRRPGTRNCTDLDPACPISVPGGGPYPVTKPYAVKLSYTDMGQCSAAVVRKWTD